jgi:hypothetical protein
LSSDTRLTIAGTAALNGDSGSEIRYPRSAPAAEASAPAKTIETRAATDRAPATSADAESRLVAITKAESN